MIGGRKTSTTGARFKEWFLLLVFRVWAVKKDRSGVLFLLIKRNPRYHITNSQVRKKDIVTCLMSSKCERICMKAMFKMVEKIIGSNIVCIISMFPFKHGFIVCCNICYIQCDRTWGSDILQMQKTSFIEESSELSLIQTYCFYILNPFGSQKNSLEFHLKSSTSSF